MRRKRQISSLKKLISQQRLKKKRRLKRILQFLFLRPKMKKLSTRKFQKLRKAHQLSKAQLSTRISSFLLAKLRQRSQMLLRTSSKSILMLYQ